jgi:hypothetical protein
MPLCVKREDVVAHSAGDEMRAKLLHMRPRIRCRLSFLHTFDLPA